MVPAKVWQRHWNVGCQAAGSGENALRYLSRYVFKTATSNRLLHVQLDGKIRWPYRDSKTGKDTAIFLEPLDWMSRFLQHILPPYFARVRTFGWLHPAAKVRANRVRALLGEKPLLTPAEEQTWHPPVDPEPELPELPEQTEVPTRCAAPLCPRCQKPMRLLGSWKPGQGLLYPNRPP